MEKYIAWSDGSFKNENSAFISYAIKDNKQNILVKYVAKLNNVKKSTDTEMFALLALMKKIEELKITNVKIFSDCSSVVDLFKNPNGNKRSIMRFKSGISKLFTQTQLKFFRKNLEWQSRTHNIADKYFRELGLVVPVENYGDMFDTKTIVGSAQLDKRKESKTITETFLPKTDGDLEIRINAKLVEVFKRGLGPKHNETMEDTLELLKSKIAKSVIFNEEKFTGFVSGRMHMYVIKNEIVKISYVKKNNDSVWSRQYIKQKPTRKSLYNVNLKVITNPVELKVASFSEFGIQKYGKTKNNSLKIQMKFTEPKVKEEVSAINIDGVRKIQLSNGFEIEVNEYVKIKKGMPQKTDQEVLNYIEKKMEDAYKHQQLKLFVKGNWHFYTMNNTIIKVKIERSEYTIKWEQERNKKKPVLA